MLPKPHIYLGAIFTFIFYFVFPKTEWYYLVILFLATFLIDFDHYMVVAWKNKNWSLKKAYVYYLELEKKDVKDSKKGIFKKSEFVVFHTIEFHLLILIVGLFFKPFLYVFDGMAFHSILDFVYMLYKRKLYRREFLFGNWLIEKLRL